MTTPTPQISIVIPVYNRAGIVARTLDSVAAQTARPLRVILVDNASTDASRQVLDAWASAHSAPGFEVTVLEERKKGAACARNRGLEAVETPWTMFFDSDDVMLPGHLERVLRAIEEYPDVDIFGWDVRTFSPSGSELSTRFEASELVWHNIMHGSMATLRYCARTECFRRAGGWCESLGTWDDIELGTRLLALNPRVRKLEGERTVEVFVSEESITGPSFAASMEQCVRALGEIEKHYPGPLSHVRMKGVILAADCALDGRRREGRELLGRLVGEEPRAVNRLAYRLAYLYRRLRLRGAAIIFKPLLR